MKKLFKIIKKHWITVWLIIAVVAVITASMYFTFAAYTGIFSVKRVVSTTASAGILFSSNSMQKYASVDTISSRHITTSQASGNYTYNLTVCDFAQADPLTRYMSENGITYDMTAQLYVKINGYYYPVNDTANVSAAIKADAANRAFSIKYISDGGEDVSAENSVISLGNGQMYTYSSQVIRPQVTGSAIPNGTNKYAVVFDEYELGDNQTIDYYVKVTATPTNGAALDPIACYLYLTKSVTADAAWSGRLQETGNTSDYDAYNYILEGSGTGSVTVRWNSNYIDVSEIFIAQNNITVFTEEADGNGDIWKHFDLNVDNTTNRFEIQLYKNNEGGDYSSVLTYINCSYTAE